MRRFAMVLVIGLIVASGSELAAQAQPVDYGWEDGTNTILDQYGNVDAFNVDATGGNQVRTGARSLKLVDQSSTGPSTPQAYVGWITGLSHGEEVTASAWVYDDTPGASPSGTLWAHYTSDPSDIGSYAGSTFEGTGYSNSNGWSFLHYTWTFDVGDPPRDGLVIEVRTFSTDGDTIWVDDLQITAPSSGVVWHPGNYVPPPPTPEAIGKFAPTHVNQNVTFDLYASAPETFSIASYTITELTTNGTLWDNGTTQITTPGYTISGATATLQYRPNTDWSGLDTFWFQVTDNQVPPQTSEPAIYEVGVQTGGVVITEAMYDPSSFQSTYEFVEIYNRSGAPVTLTRLDGVPTTDGSNKATAGNLSGQTIGIDENALKLLAIDNTVDYPDSAGMFRCEWGQDGAASYSLYESEIIQIPAANWEYLYASPAPGDPANAWGARILLFGEGGILLDAVDLSVADVGCSGTSYAYEDLAGPPTTALNDLAMNWQCADALAGKLTGATGDTANPRYVNTFIEDPDYADPCYGGCCLQDASCAADVTGFECRDLGGTWKGDDTICNTEIATFVGCLSGPGVGYGAGCSDADMDADGDVDLYDFYLYQPNTCPEFCTTIANQPPYPPQYDRIPVCVTGAVVCNTQDVTSSASAKSIHIQDPGGLPGVTIYGTNAEFAVANPVALDNLQLGDVIEIQAHGMNFFGTNELVTDYDDFEVTLLSTGNPAPTPTVLTIAQFSDDYLSTLITVQDVSFTDAGGTFVVETNYEITEAGSGATTDVRISGDTNGWIGQTIPSGQRDVIGILGQYNGVYQIKVRYYPDDIPAHVP